MSYWICQLAGWATYTLLKLLTAVEVEGLPWPGVTVALVLLNGAGLGLTHCLRAFMRRQHWEKLSTGEIAWRGI